VCTSFHLSHLRETWKLKWLTGAAAICALCVLPACSRSASRGPAQASGPLPEVAPSRVVGGSAGDPERGNYLASIFVCRACHTLREADGEHLDPLRNFAGGVPFEGPWGVVESANVSMVAARLPAAVLEDTIRGRMDFKFQMPGDLYTHMAANDMRDLIAYLRTLKPVERARPKSHLRRGYHPPPPLAVDASPRNAPKGRSLERGKYLIVQSTCKDCHSPRAKNGVDYDEAHVLAGGGVAFRNVDGTFIIPPNLTSDPETGLGNWSEDDIVRAVRTGYARDGHRLNPVMPYSVAFFELTDDDAHAIAMYLKTVPPVHRKLPKNPEFKPNTAQATCCFPVHEPLETPVLTTGTGVNAAASEP
jgi:mono/diheme cytochrome c family protein